MQVNRSTSRSFSDTNATPTGSSTSASSARDDRRVVKKLASSIDADLARLGRIGHFSTDVATLTSIENRLKSGQRQLAILSATNVDTNAPRQSGLRKARSAVVLGGGVAGRATAVVGASVVGVAEAGYTLVASPVVGTINGAVSGFRAGARAFGGYTVPVTVPVYTAVGAAFGCVSGITGGVLGMAVAPALKGSKMRKTYSHIDQYAKARAHVAKKKMSTRDIVYDAQHHARVALSKAEQQRSNAELLSGAAAELQDFVSR